MFGETLNRCFGWMLPPSKKSLAMEMKEVSDSCRESLTSGRVNMLLDEIKSAAQNGAVVFYIKPALAEFYYRPEIIQVLNGMGFRCHGRFIDRFFFDHFESVGSYRWDRSLLSQWLNLPEDKKSFAYVLRQQALEIVKQKEQKLLREILEHVQFAARHGDSQKLLSMNIPKNVLRELGANGFKVKKIGKFMFSLSWS
jgi:hypothetical protein